MAKPAGLVAAVSLGLLSVALLASTANAGPPFRTDDPEPVDYQHWEFYSFSTGTHVSDDMPFQIGAAARRAERHVQLLVGEFAGLKRRHLAHRINGEIAGRQIVPLLILSSLISQGTSTSSSTHSAMDGATGRYGRW